MFRRAVAVFLAVLLSWHGLAMSLLGADLADVHGVVQQAQELQTAQANVSAGSLSDHYVDDQPGHFFQAADILVGSWPAGCAETLPHLPPLAPKDVIHQSPLLDGLHRPPDGLPTAQA